MLGPRGLQLEVFDAGHAQQILLFGVTDLSGKGEPDLPLVIDLSKVHDGQLKSLPPEIANCSSLEPLLLDGSPLVRRECGR